MKLFDRKNIEYYNESYLNLYKNLKQDVIYLDPPWGGPEYKEKKELDLLMGKESVATFLKKVIDSEWKPDFVFIKVPANYMFDSLKILPVKKIMKYKIRGFYLLGIHIL
jgi:16S rRNA G966 N2-methylase RsmD